MWYHDLYSAAHGVCCVMVWEGVMHHTGNSICLHAFGAVSVCHKPMATQHMQGWCLSDRQHPDVDVHAQVQLLETVLRRLLHGCVKHTACGTRL